jgi:hypothetical protein
MVRLVVQKVRCRSSGEVPWESEWEKTYLGNREGTSTGFGHANTAFYLPVGNPLAEGNKPRFQLVRPRLERGTLCLE